VRLAVLALALSAAACATTRPPVVAPSPEEVARLPRLSASLPHESASLKFLVIGDSGTGGREQYEVAATIARAHTTFPFDLAIMLGDNLYGREGAGARANKFEKPYKPLLDAGVRFHAALGNHDSPDQRFYEPFGMEGRRFYAFRRGDVEFFVLDSTKMTDEQAGWLSQALGASDAPWKIAYFHHPIYSSGKRHGSQEQLRAVVEPLFLQHGVDVVFAGHEHFYERLQPQQGISYFIQGGSAKLRRNNIRDGSALTATGFDTDRSFTLVEIAGDRMFFETISRTGDVVDSGSIRRRDAGPAD
jgi:predicted phosphodiesterase